MGKPGTRHGVSLPPEHIGRVEGTEGTETSQYLEERKAKATSRVAASEMESAQTDAVEYPDGVAVSVLWELCGRTSDRPRSYKTIS